MHHSSSFFLFKMKKILVTLGSKPSPFIWMVVESSFKKKSLSTFWDQNLLPSYEWLSNLSFSKKKMKKIIIYLILIILVLLCQSRFLHLAKVSTPCFQTLFLCESSFPHLVKVFTPCFYMSQGFHTLFLCESRFIHLVSMWVKVSTPCFYVSQGFHTLPRFLHLVSKSVKVSTTCQGF